MDGNNASQESQKPQQAEVEQPSKTPSRPKEYGYTGDILGRLTEKFFNRVKAQRPPKREIVPTGFEEMTPPSYRSLDPLSEKIRPFINDQALLNYFQDLLEETQGRRSGYEFFPNPAERKELVTICDRVSTYLHDNHIGNLVLMDRSARPAYIGVKEIWKQKYPDEPLPDIYFVNPTGFVSTKEAQKEGDFGSKGLDIITDSQWKGNDVGDISDIRTEEEIQRDFEQTYQKLIADKDKPTLLFDTCIHEGNAVKPVKTVFQDIGFTNVKVGVVGDDFNRSGITPDFVAIHDQPLGVCYPFDKDRMVRRRFDSVTSARNTNPTERERSVRLRKEITRIFAEKRSA